MCLLLLYLQVCVFFFPGLGAEQQQRQQHEAEDHPQGEEGERETTQAEIQQLSLRWEMRMETRS